nr:ISAs1 family transposase [Chromohalobacter sp. 296-RDG]
MKTVGVVMSFRQEGDEVPETLMIRYTISSAELSAQKLAEAVRQHWYVENKLHWSLDVVLREDACKIHRGQAAENLARVRHIALSYLKGEKRFKGGIRRKQKSRAGRDVPCRHSHSIVFLFVFPAPVRRYAPCLAHQQSKSKWFFHLTINIIPVSHAIPNQSATSKPLKNY